MYSRSRFTLGKLIIPLSKPYSLKAHIYFNLKSDLKEKGKLLKMWSRKQYLISLLSHRKDFTVSWGVPVSASGQSCVSPSPLPHLPSLSFAEFSFPVLSRAVTATPGALPRSAIYFELPFHCHKEGRGLWAGSL